MSDAWVKRVVMLAIVLLVLHSVGAWAYALFGVVAAVASAAFVGASSVFSARMASGRGNAWFVVPTMLFTAVPLAAALWTLLGTGEPWWTRSIEFAPFIIGFAAPVFLLLAAYLELARRAGSASPATGQSPSQATASSSLSNTRVTSPTAVASRSMLR